MILGATAEDFDANGNSLGSVAVVTTGSVDVTTLGTYTLTHTATDASGNAGTATRTISVTDTIAPVVTVNPDQRNVEELIRVGEGSHYDLGATAQDQDAGNSLGSVSVVTTGSVNVNVEGSYTLTYTATDASGNAGTATRTITVSDTVAPHSLHLHHLALTRIKHLLEL